MRLEEKLQKSLNKPVNKENLIEAIMIVEEMILIKKYEAELIEISKIIDNMKLNDEQNIDKT